MKGMLSLNASVVTFKEKLLLQTLDLWHPNPLRLSARQFLVQDDDSFLTPSWKDYVQKPAVLSPQIRGDETFPLISAVFSLIINSLKLYGICIDR